MPPDSLVDLHALQLDDARALLEHDAQNGDRDADESAARYLQRVIDGLCDLSLKDPLTGLGNRRNFHGVLARAIETVARSGDSVLLLLLDIDHFKSVNDTHGHLAGDQVLRAIADCLARCVRPVDTVARYGGEEFAVLVPDATLEQARLQCEFLRQGIAVLPIGIVVSGSIGVAQYRHGETPGELIARADHALYRAKNAGRDRVEVDEGH